MSIQRFCSLLTMTLILSGCALLRKDITVLPDERAGPNLVIYFTEDSNTRRIARAIAKKTGGELFDIGGKKPLGDLLGYDTFFVGASLTDGRIAAPLADFLARTDFMDGRVIPFWTSRDDAAPVQSASTQAASTQAEDLNGEFERIIRGER
ncbi:MAG: hypothetical protein LBI85_01570, partial [Spirochaetaceae bacterium]|nr:hypothetical protein [Spirochaetaceae bacterium]